MYKEIWRSYLSLIQSALIAIVAGLALVSGVVHANTHDFYKGKIVRIIVGSSAGGGFDIYSRTIARHLGKHIPGTPTIIVENMPGAGHMIAANHLFRVAKPDGLTIGNFVGGLLMAQVLGRPGIQFDAPKFEYIGAPTKLEAACAFAKASGITSMERWMASKVPVKLGGIGFGNTTDDIPKVLGAALGLPIQLVSGYKGVAEIRLAVEGGEVSGLCTAWETIRAMWAKAIESADVVVVLQTLSKPHLELAKVPLAINFAKTEEARRVIQVGINDMATIYRPYVLPPGSPKEKVQMLRKAFMETMKEPEFLADAAKSSLDLDPLIGEELERTVAGLFKLSPSTVAKLKEILK